MLGVRAVRGARGMLIRHVRTVCVRARLLQQERPMRFPGPAWIALHGQGTVRAQHHLLQDLHLSGNHDNIRVGGWGERGGQYMPSTICFKTCICQVIWQHLLVCGGGVWGECDVNVVSGTILLQDLHVSGNQWRHSLCGFGGGGDGGEEVWGLLLRSHHHLFHGLHLPSQ